MNTYIGLLRGINVGGRNKLPMKELIVLLEDLGCQNVRTYIQSGNVVFQSADPNPEDLARQIGQAIKSRNGFEPQVLLLTAEDLAQAIATNPFPEAETEPKTLHFGFLDSVPTAPNMEKLESLKTPTERFRLIHKVFYLHAPDGIGRSKLSARSERLLGVAMTGRNWRTVCKIRELAKEVG